MPINERIFSSVEIMIIPNRNFLNDNILEASEYLKS